MKIIRDNIFCTLTDVTLDDFSSLQAIGDSLKYQDQSARHTYLYQSGRWDGMVSLFDANEHRFRSGLLERVRDILPADTLVVDNRHKNKTAIEAYFSSNIIPMDFQSKALDAIDAHDQGIIVSKTGTGKSLIASLIVSHVKAPTIILVTDLVLMEQMKSNLNKYLSRSVGMIGDGTFDLDDIVVSTYQSLQSILLGKRIHKHRDALMSYLKTVSMVISDEAHLFDSEIVGKLMPAFTNASRFYGLSATPYGVDDDGELTENLELEQHFGKVIYDTRSIDTSALRVPLVVQTLNVEPINKKYIQHKKKMRGKSVLDHSKNYKEALDTEIIKNPIYHKLIADQALQLVDLGFSVFVHASHSIQFGKDIADLIPGSALVNGSTPVSERNKIYSDISSKQKMVLVSDIGGVGLDIPSLNAIILASDVKDVRQLIGRVVRRAPEKKYGLVVDLKIKTTFLGKHADTRVLQYQSENATIL